MRMKTSHAALPVSDIEHRPRITHLEHARQAGSH
jgi:hypothetical protein